MINPIRLRTVRSGKKFGHDLEEFITSMTQVIPRLHFVWPRVACACVYFS